ncbi:MAG TPA: MarR family transcriptional regulator [Acidobacteriaceae bacterium]|nr:MarR family transcriptional regulator [Acidobacteriaceae bacterium]
MKSALGPRPTRSPHDNGRPVQDVIEELARFRYALRKFLRFSEKAARKCGVTPQQHQLMLGIAGFTGRGCASISELAEFLQERHNSVVGLIERAVQNGLVRREQDTTDRRIVVVSLTARGHEILYELTKLHQEEVRQVRAGLLSAASIPKRAPASGREAAAKRNSDQQPRKKKANA